MSATTLLPGTAADAERTAPMRAASDATESHAQTQAGRARRSAVALARGTRAVVWKSAAIVGFLVLWEVGPLWFASPATRVFLPPLHEVLAAGAAMIASGSLQTDLTASLTRSVAGFTIAVVAGILAGLLLAWYRPVGTILNPLLEVFRNTAALALLPVFTLLLGIGEESKITIVSYAAFFPVLLNTLAGVRTVDPLLIRAAHSLGLRNGALFRKVILPSAVPTIFTGIRMAGTASILLLIAAEMVGAKAGLGYRIVTAQASFLIPQMYAGILAVAVLGVLVSSLLVAFERRLSRWRAPVAS